MCDRFGGFVLSFLLHLGLRRSGGVFSLLLVSRFDDPVPNYL